MTRSGWFIAALLDKDNAAKLHATYPRGFSDQDSAIEFSGASITAANRRIVQDSGRNVRPEPGAFDKSISKDPLDQDMLAMGADFRYTVMQTLKLADKANVDHVALYFAMLNGASDSTPGDRAFAGAAYVIARSEGMAIAKDILGGRLKVDEVSTVFLERLGGDPHAVYSPEADGQLKGDTCTCRRASTSTTWRISGRSCTSSSTRATTRASSTRSCARAWSRRRRRTSANRAS
jgi:hypothetical protein